MIDHLRIENVALIDEVEVTFAPGLNVLTGETGAGKSILVDSINFMLGGKATRELVRTGASFAFVEGILECTDPFVKAGLSEFGVDTEDGQIVLSRMMQVDTGKSICKINGRTVTVGMLKEVSSLLVDVHGQHEHQSLLDSAKQMRLLDQFCGAELEDLKAILADRLKKYRETDRAIKNIAGIGNQRDAQIEMWRFQLAEIEKAALKPGEEETLTEKRDRLNSLDKLQKNAAGALELLNRSDNFQLCAVDQMSRTSGMIAELARIDAAREPLLSQAIEASQLLQDIVAHLRDYIDELDADPNELEKLESRLDVIYRIKKKYGGDVDFVLRKKQELQENLDNLENSEAEIARLKQVRRKIVTEITTVCDQIHALRNAAAEKVASGISDVLADLGMKNARFFVDIQRRTAFGPDGNDAVEFMISPNPGEPEKPLKRIASGGEMSRIMLAIKTVLADADNMDTVIFDEVDTGVSGRTAQQVAEKLMGISRRRQILCITHLPQIAAMADTHFLIEKSVQDRRTVTRVFPLENEAMTGELARLIGGAQITEATMAAAREMKAQANGLK